MEDLIIFYVNMHVIEMKKLYELSQIHLLMFFKQIKMKNILYVFLALQKCIGHFEIWFKSSRLMKGCLY